MVALLFYEIILTAMQEECIETVHFDANEPVLYEIPNCGKAYSHESGKAIITVFDEQVAKSEIEVNKELLRLGFVTQEARVVQYSENNQMKWALLTPRWGDMANENKQIRQTMEATRRFIGGTSMVFGSINNITREKVKGFMDKFASQIPVLIVNGIIFDESCYNIIIMDTVHEKIKILNCFSVDST
ncbi:hypothetical protein ECANGB1_218 [Enterospora canceri]|uniref:Uncharacterized protein n=1 Tax=Enterospora canceri TaxID=1081671 RepID=A0A1Y1S591_9MICR|nr:hypothetical protein ECANGB1_218 [Enterospora canceri]